MSCHGLKMAYRNLLKYKLQSVICVLGLAGGLSCFTVCNYMLRKELAWNKQLPHYGETYKLVTIRENGEVDGLVSLDLAEQLKQEFPEIEKSVYYVSMYGVSDKLCVVGQENGKQTAAKAFFVLTDSSFFDFYDFRLTAGNGERLKKQPDVLILTSEGADKIFGTSEAVGKSFTEVNDFENTERFLDRGGDDGKFSASYGFSVWGRGGPEFRCIASGPIQGLCFRILSLAGGDFL